MGAEEIHALRGVSIADRAGRVRRHHGPVRLGQVDADEPHRLPRHADEGLVSAERQAGQPDERQRAGAHPQRGNRLRVPDVQPAAARHRAAQRRAAARLRRGGREGPAGARQGRARASRAGHPHEPSAQRAVRRPAPARRHCPRARQQPVDPAGRRADGQPGLEDRPRDHGRCSSGCTRPETPSSSSRTSPTWPPSPTARFTSATARSRTTSRGPRSRRGSATSTTRRSRSSR